MQVRQENLEWLRFLPKLREITFQDPIDPDIKAAASFPELTSLRLIGSCDPYMSDRGIKTLRNLSRLQSLEISLESLDFDLNWQVTDSGMEVLKHLSDLRQLKLVGFPRVTKKILEKIFSLRRLRVLMLNLHGEAFDGLLDPQLQQIKYLRDLEELSLIGAFLSDEGLRHLKSLATLKKLNLVASHGFSREGLALLMRSLPKLHEVTITCEHDASPGKTAK